MVWSRESVGSRAPFLYQDSLGLCLLFKEKKEIKEAVPNVKCLCTPTAFNISLYQKQRGCYCTLRVFCNHTETEWMPACGTMDLFVVGRSWTPQRSFVNLRLWHRYVNSQHSKRARSICVGVSFKVWSTTALRILGKISLWFLLLSFCSWLTMGNIAVSVQHSTA